MNRNLEQWLALYDESHRHPANILIHRIAVPVIVTSLTAFLAALPTPLPMWANWGVLAWLLTLPFYFRLSFHAGGWMTIVILPIALLAGVIAAFHNQALLLGLCALLFALAWVAQFVGHHIEGRRPAFFTDLQFLLIGPLWCLRRYVRID